jgi:Fe-S-cluster containining protein
MNQAQEDIVAVVADCKDGKGLADAMRALYAELDERIAGHKPTCWNHGDCCKLGSYGHRLYATSAELAYFRLGHASAWRDPGDSTSCPYQIEGMCTAREHRPLGCRVFFCDPEAQQWQGPVYEEFLARIKRIAEEWGVEYRYSEWLSALKAWPGAVSDVPMGRSVDPARRGVIELSVLN